MKHNGRIVAALLASLACACGGSGFSAIDAGDDAAPDAIDAPSSGDADAGAQVDAPGDELEADGAPHDAGAHDVTDGAPVDVVEPGDGSHGLCCWTKEYTPIGCQAQGYQSVFECVDGFFADAMPDKEVCSPFCLVGQWCQVDYVYSGHPTGTVQPCP